jgi:hypothetical protein
METYNMGPSFQPTGRHFFGEEQKESPPGESFAEQWNSRDGRDSQLPAHRHSSFVLRK